MGGDCETQRFKRRQVGSAQREEYLFNDLSGHKIDYQIDEILTLAIAGVGIFLFVVKFTFSLYNCCNDERMLV